MVEELLKKIVGGIPIKFQLGFVTLRKHIQISENYSALKKNNISIEGVDNIITNSKPLIDISHPVVIVGISKTHVLAANITHTDTGNFLTNDIYGSKTYRWSQYYYIPIEGLALYINIMKKYEVTDRQSDAVIDQSIRDLEHSKPISVKEVVRSISFFGI